MARMRFVSSRPPAISLRLNHSQASPKPPLTVTLWISVPGDRGLGVLQRRRMDAGELSRDHVLGVDPQCRFRPYDDGARSHCDRDLLLVCR